MSTGMRCCGCRRIDFGQQRAHRGGNLRSKLPRDERQLPFARARFAIERQRQQQRTRGLGVPAGQRQRLGQRLANLLGHFHVQRAGIADELRNRCAPQGP